MDIKLVGEIITKFKLYSMIIDKEENILWISKKMEEIINPKDTTNLMGVFGSDLYGIQMEFNSKVKVGKDSFTLTKYKLNNEDNVILVFDLVGDYNNLKTKTFSLEKIIDNLNDGVLLSDKEGKVIIYNHAMEELEKRDSKDMLGEFIWDAYGYYDKSKSEHMQVFDSGIPIIDKYKAHAVNDGRPIYKSYSTVPIRMDGDIIGVYTISKNETKLQSLLSEIVELKRQFSDKEESKTSSNGTRYRFSDIIGSSSSIKQLIKEAEAISWLDNSILLVGNTGTGKEVFAQAMHNESSRRDSSFVAVNCGAIPESLIESELFGYEDGAFTGAKKGGRPGKFELANGGTLFLDEIGEMPMDMQVKLLRAIQEGEICRVGGSKTIPLDVRIIAATNKDLKELIDSNNFRLDLYYRLSVIPLKIPPLRERKEDIPLLIKFFMNSKAIKLNKEVPSINSETYQMLLRYEWPGNIRELENFIEKTVNLNGQILLDVQNEQEFRKKYSGESSLLTNQENLKETKLKSLADIECEAVCRTIELCNGNISKASKILGISRNTLYLKCKQYSIQI